MEKKDYLEHLTGLRGLAIILVVMFHLDSEVWSHGYLGVDVFLVITGYLLCRARLAKKKKTTWKETGVFLARRVQRIVPPMLVVILITLLAGLVLLWWRDLMVECKLGYAAVTGRANYMLMRELENYFANDSAFMPMLHLWYLSVTLQAYLLYALADQALQRAPKCVIAGVLAVVGGASFLYCYSADIAGRLAALGVSVGDGIAAASYYDTLPRLWEVMAGGVVCVLPGFRSRAWASVAAVGGLVMILTPALAGALFGGSWAGHLPCTLLVVSGAVLLLRYTPESCVSSMMSSRILQGLGAMSFSLYLVHMPVMVYMRMWVIGQMSVGYEALMLGVSLAAAVLFWAFVERRRFSWKVVVLLWLVTFFCCRAGRKTEGFRWLVPRSSWEIPTYTAWRICDDMNLLHDMDARYFPFTEGVFHVMNQLECIPKKVKAPLMALGDDSKNPSCVLIGDSHAQHAYAGLDDALRSEGIAGVFLSSYMYPFHGWQEDKRPVYNEMSPRERELLGWLSRHPELTHVVIGQRWSLRMSMYPSERIEHDLRIFLQELRQIGKKAVIIGPAPEFPKQAALMHYDKIFLMRHMSSADAERESSVCDEERYMEVNGSSLQLLRKMQAEGLCTLVEPLQTLEPGDVFRTVKEGRLMMKDDNHMYCSLAVELMQKLRPALRKALK